MPDLAVRSGRYKLVCEYDGTDVQLFDLEQDPGETRDVAGMHPDLVDSLKAGLIAWHESMPSDRGAELAHRGR